MKGIFGSLFGRRFFVSQKNRDELCLSDRKVSLETKKKSLIASLWCFCCCEASKDDKKDKVEPEN